MVPRDRTRGDRQTEDWEIPFEHQKTLFHFEGNEKLSQVAERGVRMSLPGDSKKPSGHGPVQLGLSDPG